jgi:hypothetical protein
MRTLSPRSVTTSTGQPRSCSRSYWSPPRSKRVRPGSSSTRKSRSLCAPASPRATEPKTRTFRAPYLAQTRRISSRLLRTCSSSVIPELLQVGGILPAALCLTLAGLPVRCPQTGGGSNFAVSGNRTPITTDEAWDTVVTRAEPQRPVGQSAVLFARAVNG